MNRRGFFGALAILPAGMLPVQEAPKQITVTLTLDVEGQAALARCILPPQRDLPDEAVKVLHDNLWELYDTQPLQRTGDEPV